MIRNKIDRVWTADNTPKRIQAIMNKLGVKSANGLARTNIISPATTRSIQNWLNGQVPSRYYSQLLNAVEAELGLL